METKLQSESIEEQKALHLLGLLYGNREIGRRLQLDELTVMRLRAASMKRLGLRGRADVIRYAHQQGWAG
jgi:DNA-binding CsgD family transcriptional regulator